MDGIPRLPSKVPEVIEAVHDAEPPNAEARTGWASAWAARLRGGLSRLSRPIGSVRWVTGQPHIALTYDDGPDPVGTEAVLNALAEHAATATFFVLVGTSPPAPDAARRDHLGRARDRACTAWTTAG